MFEQFVTFLHTANLDETAEFYEKTLGLELARDQGVCRIYKISPTGYLGFCSHLEAALPGGVIATLVTKDVDEWYSRLQTARVEIVKSPGHNPRYQIYHFFFRDPNGYLLEIQRFDIPLE
jgi:catechol 2,3-dioxygenase-like lactoylglutathione lyase family enzyme